MAGAPSFRACDSCASLSASYLSPEIIIHDMPQNKLCVSPKRALASRPTATRNCQDDASPWPAPHFLSPPSSPSSPSPVPATATPSSSIHLPTHPPVAESHYSTRKGAYTRKCAREHGRQHPALVRSGPPDSGARDSGRATHSTSPRGTRALSSVDH